MSTLRVERERARTSLRSSLGVGVCMWNKISREKEKTKIQCKSRLIVDEGDGFLTW
jgi:hypothetical protein